MNYETERKRQLKERKNIDKLASENAALRKTSAFLAQEARRTERAMDRARWRR